MVEAITVLPKDFLEDLTEALQTYKNLTEDNGDMMDFLFEEERNGVEVRAFPSGEPPAFESYPVDRIEMEVFIDDGVEWYERLGEYSRDNLRNGGPVYEALDTELRDAVTDAGLPRPEFVKKKGGGAFTATLDV